MDNYLNICFVSETTVQPSGRAGTRQMRRECLVFGNFVISYKMCPVLTHLVLASLGSQALPGSKVEY